MKRLYMKATLGVALAGLVAGAALADGTVNNPYSPAYGHRYRHGVVPTIEVHKKMKDWESKHAALAAAATSANTLSYNGGTPSNSQGNVGVMNGKVKVYLVFYGSGWGTQSTASNGDAVFSGDPDGAAQVAQDFFKDIGTGGELWSADLTQWCQGISSGSQSCPAGTPGTSFVPYQQGGILAGVWEDTSAQTPINATGAMLAQEAIAAAQHFGNTTAASNRYAYYVIMSATGDDPDNYQSPTQGYCAWHDWNGDSSLSGGAVSSPVGDIAFSNQPYNMDQGSSCGVGFVNSPGTLDGWTMTLGHEFSEMMSDTFPAGGWTNASSGQENGDECAWISPGSAGGAANVTMGSGTFAEQAIWSNDDDQCDISHPIVNHGGGNTAPTASSGSVTTSAGTAISGTLSATDTDGDTMTFSIASNPSNGSVSLTNAATGAFTYTPNSGFSGSDSFTFEATDSAGNASNIATESITVTSSGGGGGGGGAFNSTDTPVVINDNATITDVIPVTGQGTNGPASLQVNVNITHNWSGDLEIDLIAPDGTVFVLQSPDYNNDGNINTTYTVNASAVPANGNWTLRVIDNDPWYSGDYGTLNNWGLTF